jgi:hypothetical protein
VAHGYQAGKAGKAGNIEIRTIREEKVKEKQPMAITLESTLKEVLDNPQAAAILDKYSPGFSKNPMLKLGMGMTLRKCVSFPQAKLTADQIKSLEEELIALG